MNGRQPIAVIGAACRLPGANGMAEFSDLLLAGRDAVTEIPKARWSQARFLHPSPGLPGKAYTFAAGCLDQIDRFDAAFFGMSPREAVSVDPQQRLLLELAYEAIENAGLPLAGLAGSGGDATGVYVGGSSWDFTARSFSDVASLDAYSMQGASLSSLSNRVSYLFDLRGPSLTVDTACSSSLVALHLACEAIRHGEIGVALVGGVNVLQAPQGFIGFSRASMLSRRGRCSPFDARADGYVRAEGGGVVVLKPMAAALADGDDIRAVIRGTGMNSDGRTNGFSLPNAQAQAALLRQVYRGFDVDPNDVCYFEAHGTGTPVGDPIEARAIGEALGRHRSRPLPIGSVKSNIGHLEPASGIAGLLKLIVAFEQGVIPASLHFETPNPDIPFADLHLEIVAERRPLVAGPAGVIAGINSFGFGGTNANAILEAAPARVAPARVAPIRVEPASVEPVGAVSGTVSDVAMPLLLSARSEEALRALAAGWRVMLGQTPVERIPGLLRGAAHRRQHHSQRLAVAAGPARELATRLDAWLGGEASAGIAAGTAVGGELAFIFSGNGSQWAGMAQDAMAHSPAFRAALAEVDRLLAARLGWSVAARLRDGVAPDALRHTDVAQPLLFAVQVASVGALRAHGVRPGAFAGHSAGEVAAAWAAGALSLEQACRVIVARSLAQEATHGMGGMAVVGLETAQVQEAIETARLPIAIAAVNGDASVTVAGPNAALEALRQIFEANDWMFTRLDLDYAFHSPVMEPIRGPLLAELGDLEPSPLNAMMVSTVTGSLIGDGPHGDDRLDGVYWWRNVRQPVLFSTALDRLIGGGARIFLEVGPQPVLQAPIREGLRRAGLSGTVLASLSRQAAGADPFAIIAARCHVAGASIAGAESLAGSATARGLPAYPWQFQCFAAEPTVEAVEVVNPIHDHPLLGFRDGPLPEAWSSHLSTTTDPWLADHVVNGAVLLPAAAMIEMAFAAARAGHDDAAVLEIQDLEIAHPLMLPPDGIRDCRVKLGPDGAWQLASRARLSEDALLVHATGRVLRRTSGRAVLARIDATRACETLDAAAVYQAAETLRLQYGPAFRTVSSVWRVSATEGVVHLVLPETGRDTRGYLLDPALLDGCLQGLLALVADPGQEKPAGPVVPWRFGSIRLLRPRDARPSQAALHLRHVASRSVRADIALMNAADEVVAELTDCWFVALPAANEVSDTASFWTAYVPSSRQSDLGAAPPAVGYDDRTPSAEDVPATVLMADAFMAASVFETLQKLAEGEGGLLPAGIDRYPLAAEALRWLAEDGLAEHAGSTWNLGDTTGLPPSEEIWRSLFFDVPQAGAECTLLAGIGRMLEENLAGGEPVGGGHGLSAGLREQILFASPSGARAQAALLSALDRFVANWPAGRCLRVAVAGALHEPLLRRILERVFGRAVPSRLLAITPAGNPPEAIAELLARTPGAAATEWPADAAQGSCDLVLSLYALSGPLGADERRTPEALAGLLSPGGAWIAAEPGSSRLADFLFGLDDDGVARFRPPGPGACREQLARAGLAGVTATPLGGELWPTVLLTGSRSPEQTLETAVEAASPGAGCLVMAEPGDELAAALSGGHGGLAVLPLTALEVLRPGLLAEPLRDLLLVVPDLDAAPTERLAAFLVRIVRVLLAMPDAGGARLWLICRAGPRGAMTAAAVRGLRRVAANELPDLACRILCIDPGLPDAEAGARIRRELADPDAEQEIYWTPAGRLVPRLQRQLPPPAPDAGPRRLDILRPGLLGSLAWRPLERTPPGAGEIAIEVGAAALNFRDVMWAQGLLPDEALLDGFSGPSLGLECAGTVLAVGEGVNDVRIGDRVMAVAPSALATHVVTRRHAVMRLPAELSFAAAVTIPVAFMTAVYGLSHLARLQAGERVLIHGGAGAVGLAAIQYALQKGAVVFATAGSSIRRELLRRLGVSGVFDSRGTSFVDDILAATDGDGVDVVLNSLSGELMKQSVRLLRPFGRFLEIGKRDLYRNTQIGIRPLRHNAAYFAIDMDELMAHRPGTGMAVLAEVEALLEAGQLRALPYRAFGFAEVTDAFRLLQASGHVGKIVLLPEPTPGLPVRAEFQAEFQAEFRAEPDGVYVVTGGLAGFGLEAAHFLVRHGARKLALVSRQGAETPGAAEILACFARLGVDARAYRCDVADPRQLADVLAAIRETAGALRGVVHAAMVLDDAQLAGLDAARFDRVIRPKLAGALALDRLTRGDTLDIFILFSSITTVLGTPGQASYIAANAALEALVERRRAEGLPALAVMWGPIGDAGYLARETRVSSMLSKMMGTPHMRAAQALEALPGLLRSGQCIAGIGFVDWGHVRRQLPGLAAPFWSEMPAEAGADHGGRSIGERIVELSPPEAAQVVLQVLVEELSVILKQPQAAIDPDRAILEFGVDSLMAVELQMALEHRLGGQRQLVALAMTSTLRRLADQMQQAMRTKDAGSDHSAASRGLGAVLQRHEGEPARLTVIASQTPAREGSLVLLPAAGRRSAGRIS